MNRSDALWELIGDHLTELVRLRKQERAFEDYRDHLVSLDRGTVWTADSVIRTLDGILYGGQE